ncbi:hypothetical protein PMIN06_010370 [Paraphaeosphaeria minitans]
MAKEKRIITRENIERALAKHDNDITRLFRRLMGTGDNPQSQKVKNYKAASDKKRAPMAELQRKFGRNEIDLPKLEGKGKAETLQGLFKVVNDNDMLRTLLTDSLKAARSRAVNYYHPVGTQTTDSGSNNIDESEDDFSRKSIVKQVFQAKGSLQALPCPDVSRALKKEVQGKARGQGTNHMVIEYPICSVLPPGYLCGVEFTLETHDTYATVLRGEVVWIFWPRTAENLSIMEQAYRKEVACTPDEPQALANQLKDGVIFGQPAERCLRLPPLCIFMCVATESTVLSRYQLMSASYIVDSLQVPAGFYRSCLASWGNIRAEQLFRGHSERRQKMIHCILNCVYEPYEPEEWAQNTETPGPIHDLIQRWDELKENVAKLLTREHAAKVRQVWLDILEALRSDQCAICDTHGDTNHFLEQHFDDAHRVDGDQIAPALTAYEGTRERIFQRNGEHVFDKEHETSNGDGANGMYGKETESDSHGYVAGELFPNAQYYNSFATDFYDPALFDG